MFETLTFTMAGICLGTLTGLIPGLHVNNIAPFMVALVATSGIMPLNLAALLVAMSITNVFISYIPSTFLGAPEEGTELSVLPAHRFLIEGRGFQAVRLTTFGCLGGLLLSAAMLAPFLAIITPTYEFIRPQMHWLLIFVIIVMIALEGSKTKMVWATVIFLLSGMLGLLTLDTNLVGNDAALMPLLSGLFGASVLLPSIVSVSALPEQRTEDEPLNTRENIKPLCAGTAAGAITGIVPGIGPSQGTVLAQLATRRGGSDEFLIAVSGVNTSKALFSFIALFAIGRARSGAAVAVQKIMEVGATEIVFLVGVALFAGGISTIIGLKLGKLAAKHIGFVPYRALCIIVLGLIAVMTWFYSGPVGLLVLATATGVGILPTVANVKRTHCMGVIMLPCILYFAGAKDSVLSVLGL